MEQDVLREKNQVPEDKKEQGKKKKESKKDFTENKKKDGKKDPLNKNKKEPKQEGKKNDKKDFVKNNEKQNNKKQKLRNEDKQNLKEKNKTSKNRISGYRDDFKVKELEQDERDKKPKSRCPYSKKCGGCQFIDIPYDQQLKQKQKKLTELLGEFGKPEPMIGMEQPDYYRNKVHAVFGLDHKHRPIAGVYEEKTHRVVDVESCFLENQKATAIIRTIKNMIRSFKIKTYDEDTGYGLLRHVLVRTGFQTGQIMVVLVLGSPILPSKNNFVKALLKEHPEITTIVVNVNNRNTSMVLGDKEQVIYGKGYIEDVLCGKTFKISPKSFYQVNPVQTERLYGTAIEYAGLTGKETILDAYCGIGTIGMIASDKAKRVIGVELNSDAVRDARTNAKINKIENIEIYNKDAGEFMVQLAEQGEKVDVVFMDPPRAGSDEAFLSSVVKCSPEKIVYVSCNPETLARDLQYLTKNGYKVRKMRGCDMFSHTSHCETVVLMSKKDK
ncbi:MAG: 23S rRNA (uracil(1939)-C(5))-methyltransferase RlmD [Lachnospiraceae bacterium]|nr:23S rRNA (uracil(1939)-C(5))-methyltransferase RlmD [Lachnospiraceae bacterium]